VAREKQASRSGALTLRGRDLLTAFLLFAMAAAAAACSGSQRATTSPTAPTAATPASSPTVTPTPVPTPTPDPAPDAGRGLGYVRALAVDIGPRLAGTEGARRAVAYLRDALAAWGYDVEIQQFPFSSDDYRQVDLAANGEDVPATVLQGSASGTAGAPLYDAGTGTADEFPTGVAGGVALATRGVIPGADIARNAEAAGAAALIIVHNVPDEPLIGTIEYDARIPVVGISADEGARLRRMLAGGPVTIDLYVGGPQGTGENVVARERPGPCDQVVGAHYDSVPQSYGASDNASGTATVLEIARSEALADIPGNQCFVLFGAEELGLYGSAHFVAQLAPEERRAIRAMLNFDMTGVGDTWWLIGTPALVARARDVAARDLGVDATPAELPENTSSDHTSFINAGIPAVMFHRWRDPYLHTPVDRIERVDGASVAQAAAMGIALLRDLAAGP
jgi:aminopeptidase YwaD